MSLNSVRRFSVSAVRAGAAQVAPSNPMAARASNIPGIAVGVLLQRDPVVCKELTDFERDYYTFRDNQDRQESRMFHPSFYYKKGTTLEKKFLDMQEKEDPQYLKLIEERDTAYLAKRKKKRGEKKFPDLKGSASIVQPTETFDVAPRTTEADKNNDLHNIWRALDRTLYLLVKPTSTNKWQLGPSGSIAEGERLDTAAKRNLYTSLGRDMKTWIVGGYPVGYLPSAGNAKSTTYYMKSHLLAGLPQKIDGVEDLIWVTREEMAKYLDTEIYNEVVKMLPKV